MYRVINRFYDLRSSHEYFVGDIFPHNAVAVSKARITELASDKNKLGIPLIEKIAEKPVRTRKKKDEEHQ